MGKMRPYNFELISMSLLRNLFIYKKTNKIR